MIEPANAQSIKIADDLVWFDGHFPRAPILPGVVLVQWAVEQCVALGRPLSTFRGCRRVKFLSSVLPGDDVDLEVSGSDDRVNFRYLRNGSTCASGTLDFSRSHSPSTIKPEPSTDGESTPVGDKIPHQGPMRLIDRILSASSNGATTETDLTARLPFFQNESVPSWTAIEFMAQTGATLGEEPARQGMLVSVRSFACSAQVMKGGETARTCVVTDGPALGGMRTFQGTVHTPSMVAEGTFSIYMGDPK